MTEFNSWKDVPIDWADSIAARMEAEWPGLAEAPWRRRLSRYFLGLTELAGELPGAPVENLANLIELLVEPLVALTAETGLTAADVRRYWEVSSRAAQAELEARKPMPRRFRDTKEGGRGD